MSALREWATPLTMGCFCLMAVTGVLMFFHVDMGLNKTAHEWMGWIFISGVALHSVVNFGSIKRYALQRRAQVVIGACLLILGLSFLQFGPPKEPGFATPIRAMAQAPLNTLASVIRLTPEQLRERLTAAGYEPRSDKQSLSSLVGLDVRKRLQVLRKVMEDQ